MRKLDLLEVVVRDLGLFRRVLKSGTIVSCSALRPPIFSVGCGSVKKSQTLSLCFLSLGNLMHAGTLGSLSR
jgi:hypothetical protein